MPYQKIRVQRPRVILPSEAGQIASKLYQLQARAEAVEADLYAIRTHLENNWSGKAKDRFFYTFEHQPRASREAAAYIGERASWIANLHVTIWETHWETIFVPD
jgi:uncharacterized protein YukE